MKIKYGIVIALSIMLSGQVFGQKFGYLNSASIMQEMPEVKEAEPHFSRFLEQCSLKMCLTCY